MTGLLFILLGLVFIGWALFYLPRWHKRMQGKVADPSDLDRLNARLDKTTVLVLRVVAVVVGIVSLLIGVTSL